MEWRGGWGHGYVAYAGDLSSAGDSQRPLYVSAEPGFEWAASCAAGAAAVCRGDWNADRAWPVRAADADPWWRADGDRLDWQVPAAWRGDHRGAASVSGHAAQYSSQPGQCRSGDGAGGGESGCFAMEDLFAHHAADDSTGPVCRVYA